MQNIHMTADLPKAKAGDIVQGDGNAALVYMGLGYWTDEKPTVNSGIVAPTADASSEVPKEMPKDEATTRRAIKPKRGKGD